MAGADFGSVLKGGSYPEEGDHATPDLDADEPQRVTAYVSRSVIYVVDSGLRVVAYGRLQRREVLE